LIGLDTNVLVRYVVQDDNKQAALAAALIESFDDEQGFISLVALVEFHWVIRRTYKAGRREVEALIRDWLVAREIVVEHADAVQRALDRTNDQFDFPDALIGELGVRAGCEYTATFDSAAAKLPGMRLLTARE
jgi:predicted nucleic-acid-binding protein